MERERSSCFCVPGVVLAGLELLLVLALASCQGARVSSPQTHMVTIPLAADSVVAGSPLQFVVRAAPAPQANLAVGVTITSSGCVLTDAPTSVTIAAGKTEATLTVPTGDALWAERVCQVTAAIATGDGYRVGNPAARSASATLKSGQPVVTVEADVSTADEGIEASFTLTATPAPASDLTVNVSWSELGSFLSASLSETVTIPTTGTLKLKVTIPANRVDEQGGPVTVTVVAGSGYAVGMQNTAIVPLAVSVRDTVGSPSRPVVNIFIDPAGTSVNEGSPAEFVVVAQPRPTSPLTVHFSCSDEEFDFLDGTPPSTVEVFTAHDIGDGTMVGRDIFSVATEDDAVAEPDGRVICTIRPRTGYRIGNSASTFVKVTDDDYVTVTIAADDPDGVVMEGDEISFTLTSVPAPRSAVTVNVEWSASFIALPASRPSTVTISGGSTTGTVSVTPNDEEVSNPLYPMYVGILLDAGTGYRVGHNATATVRLTEDDS